MFGLETRSNISSCHHNASFTEYINLSFWSAWGGLGGLSLLPLFFWELVWVLDEEAGLSGPRLTISITHIQLSSLWRRQKVKKIKKQSQEMAMTVCPVRRNSSFIFCIQSFQHLFSHLSHGLPHWASGNCIFSFHFSVHLKSWYGPYNWIWWSSVDEDSFTISKILII